MTGEAVFLELVEFVDLGMVQCGPEQTWIFRRTWADPEAARSQHSPDTTTVRTRVPRVSRVSRIQAARRPSTRSISSPGCAP